jgi:hypothetical protein
VGVFAGITCIPLRYKCEIKVIPLWMMLNTYEEEKRKGNLPVLSSRKQKSESR